MKRLSLVGRFFFGLGVAGMGVQQFMYAEFRPVFLSWPSGTPHQSTWAYIFGAVLILSGLLIAFSNRARTVSVGLGILFLLLFLSFHVPSQLKAIQNSGSVVLAPLINPLKELALAGSAFIIAASFMAGRTSSANKFILDLGRVFFSVMLIIFGYSHFVYTSFVETLVPAWIPGHLFWTYFGAIALMAAGLCILLKIQTRLVSILLGTMLFLWFLILHIPRAIDAPSTDKGNELTSVFQSLAFSGVAFVIASIYPGKTRGKKLVM